MIGTRDRRIQEGKPLPLGATVNERGVQFAVFSRHATSVHLLLLQDPEDAEPVWEIELDPRVHRTGDVWHVQVDGLRAGRYYLYRAYGPYRPEAGHRFNPNKLLLDPYAKEVNRMIGPESTTFEIEEAGKTLGILVFLKIFF